MRHYAGDGFFEGLCGMSWFGRKGVRECSGEGGGGCGEGGDGLGWVLEEAYFGEEET